MARYARGLRWAAAAATLMLLAALAWQCVDIYIKGNDAANLDANGVHINAVYSAEDVAARLSRFILPGAAYVLLTVFAAAARRAEHAPRKRLGPDSENRLRLAKRRLARLPQGALREEQLRRGITLGAAAAVMVCAGFCLEFLLDRDNFVSWELELVMGALIRRIGPWTALAFMAMCGASLARRASIERELMLLKGERGEARPQTARRALPVNAARVALYALAAALVVTGVMNGGLKDVLVKAINICTECIGLG